MAQRSVIKFSFLAHCLEDLQHAEVVRFECRQWAIIKCDRTGRKRVNLNRKVRCINM